MKKSNWKSKGTCSLHLTKTYWTKMRSINIWLTPLLLSSREKQWEQKKCWEICQLPQAMKHLSHITKMNCFKTPKDTLDQLILRRFCQKRESFGEPPPTNKKLDIWICNREEIASLNNTKSIKITSSQWSKDKRRSLFWNNSLKHQDKTS
jgi:hypothetical protein